MQNPGIQISFCTTCCGRTNQLKQTFAANATIVAGDVSLEWIIVNYGSKDDLHAFMMAQLPQLPARIVYAQELSGNPWHASVAKNTAHRLGSGQILMNLDCDNYIGSAAEILKNYFDNGCQALHLWSGVNRDGTGGRIALSRDLFYKVGGYDETFLPMGYQDYDLLARASASGAAILEARCAPGMALQNDKVASIRNCKVTGLAWEDFDRLNRERSRANLAAGLWSGEKRNHRGEIKAILCNGTQITFLRIPAQCG